MAELAQGYLILLLTGACGLAVGLLIWVAKRPVRGLYLTIFATSILITPHLPVVREKVTGTEVLVLLTWFVMLARPDVWRNRSIPLQPSQKKALMLGWLFIAWVALSFLVNNLFFDKGLVGSIVESVNYLYGFLMFRTVLLLVDDWGKWNGCLTAWIMGAVVVSVVGVLAVGGAAPGWAYEDFTGRVSSTLRNENQVPSFLFPVLVAVIFMAVKKGQVASKRFLLTSLAAGMVATIFGTGSRTAMGMLALCLLGAYYLALREWPFRAFNRVLLTKLAFGLVGGVVLYASSVIAVYEGDYALGRTPAWQRPVVMLYDWSQGHRVLDETREIQFEVVSENFLDHLVLGAGPKLTGIRYGVAEIHNTYFGILMDLGLPGCLLFLVWLLYVLKLGWSAGSACPDPYRRLLVLSLCVGMGALMLYSMFMFGLRQRNLWLLAGLLTAVPRLLAYQPVASTQVGPGHIRA